MVKLFKILPAIVALVAVISLYLLTQPATLY
jgi:hypothetical protein